MNTSERERLKQILSTDICDEMPRTERQSGCEGCPYKDLITETSTCFESRYADHLIRNRVRAFPCTPGQEMYVVTNKETCFWDIYKCKVTEITITESNTFVRLVGKGKHFFAYDIEEIGRTVFENLTDAEELLREMIVNT